MAMARKNPRPTTKQPSMARLEKEVYNEGVCTTTDGCKAELDGLCPHGHPSWVAFLGLA